jgi:predicted transcriptional regulator
MENEQGMNGNEAPAGGALMHDYRDDLRDLLDKAHAERGLTRYRLCKQMGIDSGTLSNVLAKRRHFSLEKLEQILGLLGYRLSFSLSEGGVPPIS